jgi:hypothetical protein
MAEEIKLKLTRKRLLEDYDVNNRETSWKEIPLDQKIACQRQFIQNIQEIEDMEIKIEKLRRENQEYRKKWPDLLPFEGLMDKWFKKKMWPVQTTDGTLRVFGTDREKALKDHQERVAKESKNREKNPKGSKKVKLDKDN